jgi:hypothetical protein
MLDLQMCKAHLYFLARIARSLELGRAFQQPGMVARIFVDVAGDLLERPARTSMLERAGTAVLRL